MKEGFLSARELRRYRKQILLPEIGIEGQKKLKSASVLVVGAGGLGCPVLQYLSAAGTGRIAIVEYDIVDEVNLQRQLLYGSDDLGKLKAIIAKKRLEQLNSFVNVEIKNLRLDATNAKETLKDFDVIIDATDNLETRYVISDACVMLGKPMVHGAIYKYEGQVAVFNYKGGATYRCYNPFCERDHYKNPAPSETGLLGVLPGITGTFMANETIKIITGVGNVLDGEVLIFNIMNYTFYTVRIKNNPDNHKINILSGPPGEKPIIL
jgi:adenylyltransferase/sulfurtransferase